MESSKLGEPVRRVTAGHPQRLAIDGVHAVVRDSGGERSEAVVFVHGNPGSSRDWGDLANAVAPFARAVALDMPGFGQADKPDDFEYTVEGYARYLDAVLQALGIRRAHLVLHDFGGPWGLAWAAQHPSAVASVTLLNTGVLAGYRWHALARIWRVPLLGELFQRAANRTGFRRLLAIGAPRGMPREFVDGMYDDYDRGTRRAVLRLYRATSDLDGVALALTAALRPYNIPALVVWGRHDPYVPARFAERQRDTFPSAQILMLDESGHWPHADDPDAVRNAVVPFLQSCVARD